MQIRNLSYIAGDRTLFKDVDWTVHPGRKYALIGPNGAGKTTLLRILTSELEAYTGDINSPKSYKTGYLPQEESSVFEGTVMAAVFDGQKELQELESRIHEVHREMADSADNQEALVKKSGELEQRFDALGGYALENRIKTVLFGLGFKEEDLHRQVPEFSGGWRMRIFLARLLVAEPDLLLLDEPTNHLDLPSLEWLEGYLKTFKGSIIFVSHDRFFVNRLADEIKELDLKKLNSYKGNYRQYEIQKEEARSLLFKKHEAVEKERDKLEKFVERFRYKASKASQAQMKIKQLEKLEEIELPPPPPSIGFNLQVSKQSYKDVVDIKSMTFAYETEAVLKEIDLNIYRGERVSLTGVNGAGKTTLTKLIFGDLTPQTGSVKIGENVEMGYFAQHQTDALDVSLTIMEEMMASTATSLVPRIRSILGLFQFHGDDVNKRIGVLSGGEKARVSLAKILLSPVNFLIMDEPTNHLDQNSKAALEEALKSYEGTLLLISHDRYFLDNLVQRVIEIRDGDVTSYDENYSGYLAKRDKVEEIPPAEGGEKEVPVFDKVSRKEEKRLQAEARQAISKERNRVQKEINIIEKAIETAETRKSELEEVLADSATYENGSDIQALQKEFATVSADLDVAMEKWEKAQEELEEIMSRLN